MTVQPHVRITGMRKPLMRPGKPDVPVLGAGALLAGFALYVLAAGQGLLCWLPALGAAALLAAASFLPPGGGRR